MSNDPSQITPARALRAIGQAEPLARPEAADRLLAASSPNAVTKAVIEAVEKAIGVELREDERGGWLPAKGVPQAALDKARRIVANGLASPEREEIFKALKVLELAAIPSKDGVSTDRLSLYADELCKLPADCVYAALNPTRWRFFPALADLVGAAKEQATKRIALASALALSKPRTAADDLADLEQKLESARFDSRYFARKDPARADRALKAIPRLEARLTDMKKGV